MYMYIHLTIHTHIHLPTTSLFNIRCIFQIKITCIYSYYFIIKLLSVCM